MPVSALGPNFNGFVDFTSKEDHLKYCEQNLLSNTLLLQAETFIPDASKSLSGAEISASFNLSDSCILGLQIYNSLSRGNIFAPDTRLFFDANFHFKFSSIDDFAKQRETVFSKYPEYKNFVISLLERRP